MLGVFGEALDVASDDQLGDFGGEEGFAGVDGVDGGDEVAHGVGLQYVAAGAGIDDLLNHFGSVMHRKHEDVGATAVFENLAGGLQAIEAGHADVEKRDVGIEQANSFDGSLAVRSFADDGPAELRLEKIAQTEPDNFVVVCQEQPKRDQSSPHMRSAPNG